MPRQLISLIAAAAVAALLGACAQGGGYDRGGGYGTDRATDDTSGYRASDDYCANCGTVEEITVLEESSRGIGAGAVLGTIAGGLLGSQVGSGQGQTAATVAGAAGGAYAGHELQKRHGNNVDFRVTVETDDGRILNVTQDNDPRVNIGQRVQVVDGRVAPL